MNCKPGDLAIIVSARSTPEMIGMIVEILRPYVNGDTLSDGVRVKSKSESIAWWVRSKGSKLPTRMASGNLKFYNERVVQDFLLKPIRGNEENQKNEILITLKEGITWIG